MEKEAVWLREECIADRFLKGSSFREDPYLSKCNKVKEEKFFDKAYALPDYCTL